MYNANIFRCINECEFIEGIMRNNAKHYSKPCRVSSLFIKQPLISQTVTQIHN